MKQSNYLELNNIYLNIRITTIKVMLYSYLILKKMNERITDS